MQYNYLTTDKQILFYFKTTPNISPNKLDENGVHILDWLFNGYRGKQENKIHICRELINNVELKKLSKEILEQLFFQTLTDKEQDRNTNSNIIKKLLNTHIFLNNTEYESQNLLINTINSKVNYSEVLDIEKKLILKNTAKYLPSKSKNLIYFHPIIYSTITMIESKQKKNYLNYLLDIQDYHNIDFNSILLPNNFLSFISNNSIIKYKEIEKSKNISELLYAILNDENSTFSNESLLIIKKIIDKNLYFKLQKNIQSKNGIINSNKFKI